MEADISRCVETLKNEGVILYPTDTIWGIGCDATKASAVEKIHMIKGREPGKGLIVLVCDDIMLNRYAPDAPAVAWELIEASDGPLTVVLEKIRGIAPNVLGPDGTCGFRIVQDEFCRKMIRKFGKGIISTSANLSGAPSPASFSEIAEELKSQMDYIVNHRRQESGSGKASSVISVKNNGEVKVLRK